MRTTSFLIPADFFRLGTRIREPGRGGGRPRLMAQLRSEIEPEHRLYKLSGEAGPPKVGRLELIAFLFFGVLVSGATAYCGTELFHLVNSDVLQHTVQTLLSK